MDWIEKLLHITPDGGNGSLEVGIVAGAAVALAMVITGTIKVRPVVKHWFILVRSRVRESESTSLTRFDG
ncbi:MAG TPA: hypothetical protein VGA35_14475 [bacterium]